MSLLLGIDFGTSYFKVGLFDAAGMLRGLGRVAVTPLAPAPGHCELPVEVFWRLLRQALAEALQQAGQSVAQIAGLSYSSQANTFLLLDREDVALTPLVLWTDTRASCLDESWRQFTLSGEFGRTAGFNGSSVLAAAAKWRWFQQYEPAQWARARSVMTLSDYFAFAMTGERVGDAGTASLLGTLNLQTRDWWPEALSHHRIQDKQLSRPLRPGSAAGQTGASAAQLLGLPPGIPFAVGSLDHHVAALGSGLGHVADAGISTGTVLAAIMLARQVLPQARCYHGPGFREGEFFRLAFDPAGAAQLEEYQRTFAPELTIEQLIALAAKVPAGAQPDHLPRSGDGERERALHVRFLLEKIAFDHRQLLERLDAERRVKRVVASGGAARSDLWLQIKADVWGRPVFAQIAPESACLGAAMLAGVAAGFHADVSAALAAMCHPGRHFSPMPENVRRYRDWVPRPPAT